jgi:CheY-like chemotaxis protein
MLYKSILLIDDDLDDAEILFEAVKSLEEKIICRIVTSPVIALEELKSGQNLPELIFLDLNMPIISGPEFLQQLKKEAALEDIPVIVYSSHTIEIMQKLTRQFEKVSCISKPNDYKELVSVLQDIL